MPFFPGFISPLALSLYTYEVSSTETCYQRVESTYLADIDQLCAFEFIDSDSLILRQLQYSAQRHLSRFSTKTTCEGVM